jgi:hypothetical protein
MMTENVVSMIFGASVLVAAVPVELPACMYVCMYVCVCVYVYVSKYECVRVCM